MRSSAGTQTLVAGPSTSGRRQSTRQGRTTSNYYTRPFAGRGSTLASVDNGPSSSTAPGMCPAITHFTDAVAALPKEVIRHFSMLKEVEAKVHGPDQELERLVDEASTLPPPPSYRQPPSLLEALAATAATNSANVSVNGSFHNGATPVRYPGPPADHQHEAQEQPDDAQADVRRRQLFGHLSFLIHQTAPILDEKIAVLAAANQTLATQLARMDSSYPYIAEEVSEEARLGSLAHWAYAEKESRKMGGATNERTRRDVAAANNLAAAAAAVHEGDVAASRSEARREAMLANKRNRNQHVDSDFDDRPPPKKAPPNRVRKPADAVTGVTDKAVVGLGITAAQPSKRRRTDKNGVSAPGMERSMSGAVAAGSRAGVASPRETPAAEKGKKKSRAPAPPPARKR